MGRAILLAVDYDAMRKSRNVSSKSEMHCIFVKDYIEKNPNQSIFPSPFKNSRKQ